MYRDRMPRESGCVVAILTSRFELLRLSGSALNGAFVRALSVF